MLPIQIKPNIYWVGVNDRTTELFEGLWPVRQEGVSYNSYLIDDEKKVLIDLSKEMMTHELLTQIQTVMDLSRLDYVVINHMEPDHSGALQTLLQIAPQVTLIGTAKTRDMLKAFYGITENVKVVADGETLALGEHTLRFIAAPFVHWPETMMTYEISQAILFSCDAFGGYGALSGTIFDDPAVNVAWYETEALRYYTNIVATFSKPVRNAIAKIGDTPLAVVAPSHGLIWRNTPQRIVKLYQKWANYASEAGELGVTLLYATMYGNTEHIMEVIAQGIADENVPVSIYNISSTHTSYILPSLWMRQGVMVGAPTYEGGLFPAMTQVLTMANIKHVYNKQAARFGSFAWNGGAQREFDALATTLKWQNNGSFEFSGTPSPAELNQGRVFGIEFARKLKVEAAVKAN
jgi:flavorubredoxin